MVKGISAGSVPDRSFFPATSSPITVPPTSISLSPAFTSTWWQRQSGFHLRELFWGFGGVGVGRGRKRKEGEGRRMTKTDGTLPPPQNHFFFLPPLTSLAWKRKVSARVVMVKFQSHRFVFHLEDHRSISGPRTQL